MNKEELIEQLKRASTGGNCTLLLCDNLGESVPMVRLMIIDGGCPLISPDELRLACCDHAWATAELPVDASFAYAKKLAQLAGCRLLVQVITEKASVRKWVEP